MEQRVLIFFFVMAVGSSHGAPTDSTVAPSSTTPLATKPTSAPVAVKPTPKPISKPIMKPMKPPTPPPVPLANQPDVPASVPAAAVAVPDCQNTTDVYDQSQSGTENYRVNIKGFTFLVAPSDALLGAAMLMSGMDEKAIPALNQQKPENQNKNENMGKMSRLLQMFKRLHDHQGKSVSNA